MTTLRQLGAISVSVTGARGRVGLDIVGTPEPGQFVVWNGDRKVQGASGTGNDSAFRTDAAATTGAGLIGSTGNRSVQTRLDAVDQGLTVAPLGNFGATLSSQSAQIVGSSANAAKREFGRVLSFYSAFGEGGVNDKCARYDSFWAAPGSGDGWAYNLVYQLETNGAVNHHGIELDVNHIGTNKFGAGATGGSALANGTKADGSAIGNVAAHGLAVTGISTQGGTWSTGVIVAAAGSNLLFNVGYAAGVGSVYASYLDASGAAYGYLVAGAHAVDGINTEIGSFGTSAIKLGIGATQSISAKNPSGTTSRMVYMNASGIMVLGDGANAFVGLGNSFLPLTDNAFACGGPSNRFTAFFATSGTINTSDEREKAWRGALSPDELAAAKEIASAIGVYQFDSAIAEKGSDKARLHFGVKAQQVWGTMAAHGLVSDASTGTARYAFLCYDKWDAVAAIPEVAEVLDDKGHVVTAHVSGEPAKAAGDRYGIRPDELHFFLIAGQEQRILALEAAR